MGKAILSVFVLVALVSASVPSLASVRDGGPGRPCPPGVACHSISMTDRDGGGGPTCDANGVCHPAR
jgi:hypothetical protein